MSHALRTRLSARLLIPCVLALVCGSVVSLPAAADDAPVLPVAPAASRPASPDAATDQFIVKFKDNAAAGSRPADGVLRQDRPRTSGVPVNDIRGTAAGARVLRTERPLDAGEAEKALTALRADPAVEYAEPDTRMYPTAAPNDPYYPLQWGLHVRRRGRHDEHARRVVTQQGRRRCGGRGGQRDHQPLGTECQRAPRLRHDVRSCLLQGLQRPRPQPAR